MKFTTKLVILLTLLFSSLPIIYAQNNSITEKYKEHTIHKLSQLMNDFYVFPKVAKQTEKHLLKQLSDGHFKQFKDDESFAIGLTESVQTINKDKHMRIRKNRSYEVKENSPESKFEDQLSQINRSRSNNSGFNEVKVLEGNVGYLDLRGFAGIESGKPLADAYMKLMANTDAIIIDLSKNGGGSPKMVQYLCSYFFEEIVHLNSLYYREGNQTIEYWTLEEVGGVKMPDIPLFVVTSERTFSGAEEFSYNMQTQKRATLVGQTSGGGANPGGTMGLNENLHVFIPTGRAINPITKTNWEGVGVIPDIKTEVEETFDKTYQLAKEAAKSYRSQTKERYREMYMSLLENLDQHNPETSDELILKGLKKCQEATLFEEWSINALGYEYLKEHMKPRIAQSIFRANTILHPNSANVFDSYAECLMINGDLNAAIKNYEKAVENATKNDDGDIELFKKNLKRLKKKMNK